LGLNYAFRPYFQQVRELMSPAFSTVLQDIPANYSAVVIAVPVLYQGELAGVLAGEFALDRSEWARDLDLLQTEQGGRAYVVDSAGTIIYHPDPSLRGRSVRTEPALWELMTGAQANSATYRPTGTSRTMAASYSPIPGIAWAVMVEEPWHGILSIVRPYQWVVGGLMAFGVLLALAALLLSVRRVTRPVNALIAAGQRVADGEPFHPLPLQGPPDIRTLITVINQMVARLAEQGAALRRYALLVLRGQEEERLRIARDLHDETVQDLIALAQRIELCTEALEEDPAAARDELVELQTLTHRAISEVRRMSNHLRPSILEDLGLVATLQVLARELNQQLPQAHVSCEIVGQETRLATELELTAFRVAQEALTNVRRHAATATRVSIALFFEGQHIQLLIEDDGPGFLLPDRESLIRDGHLGLTGMAERAHLFGGQLDVSSLPGEGTTVSLRLASPVGDA
jgi:signal transduction histidine kinase